MERIPSTATVDLDERPPERSFVRRYWLRPASDRDFLIAAALVALVFVLGAAYAAAWRGLWYDEGWSIFEARHDVGFAAAWRERWLLDVHPPYFHLITYLLQPLTGDGIAARRMANILPLILAGIGFATVVRHRPSLRPVAALAAILMLAVPLSLGYFAEHRSYFWLLTMTSLIALCLYAIDAPDSDYRPTDRPLLIVCFFALLAVFSLHYVVGFSVGIILFVFIILSWARGFRAWVIRLTIAAVLAACPVLVSTALQGAHLAASSGGSWITTTTPQALAAMRHIARNVGTACVVPLLMVAGSALTERGLPGSPQPLRFALRIGAGIAIAAIILLAVNVIKPLIVPRYLVGFAPFPTVAVAGLTAHAIRQRGALLWLAALCSIGIIIASAISFAGDERWDGTARFVAERQHACPQAIVHAVPHWRLEIDPVPLQPNEGEAVRAGYSEVARQFGIRLAPSRSRDRATTCPTLIWVEHFQGPLPSPAKVALVTGLRYGGETVRRFRSLSGFVMIFPPAAAPARGTGSRTPMLGSPLAH